MIPIGLQTRPSGPADVAADTLCVCPMAFGLWICRHCNHNNHNNITLVIGTACGLMTNQILSATGNIENAEALKAVWHASNHLGPEEILPQSSDRLRYLSVRDEFVILQRVASSKRPIQAVPVRP